MDYRIKNCVANYAFQDVVLCQAQLCSTREKRTRVKTKLHQRTAFTFVCSM